MKKVRSKLLFGAFLITAFFILRSACTSSNFTSTTSEGQEVICERGSIRVPELKDMPDGKQIKVKYVKLKSFSKEPKSPIFFLAGGPGNGATFQAKHGHYLDNWAKYLKTRDVILIDQRGVKKWTLYHAHLGKLDEDVFVSAEGYNRHFDKLSNNAQKTFKRRGINLNAYTTIENASDIDAIRTQLGYEQIVILGFSYGTHLGQAYLKYYGEHVEYAIFAGTEGLDETFKFPMNMDKQFSVIAEMVNNHSELSQKIPDFEALYEKVATKLEKNPITLKVKTPWKSRREIKIGKYGLDYILRRDIGDLSDISVFPKLLLTIDNGDYGMLNWFVQKRYPELLFVPAMTASMDISSGASQDRLDEIKAQEKVSKFGNITNAPFLNVYGKWKVKDLGEEFRKPVESNVPSLFLSGSLDLNTPSYQAEKAMQNFTNASHIVIENAGHEQILSHHQSTETINKFLNGDDVSETIISYGKVRFAPLD